MKNSSSKKKIVFKVLFILIELVLYGSFMYLDITNHRTNLSMYIKFFGIFLCFLFVMLYYKNANQKNEVALYELHNSNIETHILRIAMFFTLISDLFILVLDYYTIGIITFIIVQFLYLALISSWISSGKMLRTILIRTTGAGVITALIVTLYRLHETKVEIEVIFAVYYFIIFVSNAMDATGILFRSKRKGRLLFACGLLAYFLCDINVAIFNLKDYINIDEALYTQLYSFSSIAMWMFYLPGQVAIALSGES